MDFLLSNDEYFKWKSLYVKEDKKKNPIQRELQSEHKTFPT